MRVRTHTPKGVGIGIDDVVIRQLESLITSLTTGIPTYACGSDNTEELVFAKKRTDPKL